MKPKSPGGLGPDYLQDQEVDETERSGMTQHAQTHQQASFDGETWLQRKARMERSLAAWLKEPEGATRDSVLANIQADIRTCELYIAEENESD